MKNKYFAHLAIAAVLGELALISSVAALELMKGWMKKE